MVRKLARNETQLKAREVAASAKAEIIEPEEETFDPDYLVPSGSALLNLACSDSYKGAYKIGKIINPIGDRSTGKTYFALTSLAEAASRKQFDEYRFIFRSAETELEFKIRKLFGKRLKDRLEVNDDIIETIEDVYGDIMTILKYGQPFIYVLDSLDSVTSTAERKRAEIYAEGKEPDGSYKTEKPRLVSELLRVTAGEIKRKEALIQIISQTRDNIGFGAMFKPKVRAGGKALEFYVCHEMWHAIKSPEKRKGIEIGNIIETRVTKNKLTGKKRIVETPIYPNFYGIDSITGGVDWLVKEGYWKTSGKSSKKIEAKEFDIIAGRYALVRQIEEQGLEHELDLILQSVWDTKEEDAKIERKPKFE